MTELANFPMISQRDGDANQDYDCVPTSIAAALQWLTGRKYTGGEIKDAVYGAGYVGGTAASAYVDYCARQGVKLAPVNGNGEQLVADLRSAITAGHPSLITEPDPYAAGWSHVCVAYKDDGGSITVMDPWIDEPVVKSDAAWATQLEDNQIWVLEKIMQVPKGWRDDGTTLTAPSGFAVVLGFRQHVLSASSWDAGNVPQGAEYHVDQVLLHNVHLGPGQRQVFRDCELWYTTAQGVVQEPYLGMEIDAAYKQITSLQAEIASLKGATPVNAASLLTQLQAADTAIAAAIREVSPSA